MRGHNSVHNTDYKCHLPYRAEFFLPYLLSLSGLNNGRVRMTEKEDKAEHEEANHVFPSNSKLPGLKMAHVGKRS